MKKRKIAGINITKELLKEILNTPEDDIIQVIPFLVFPLNGDIGMTWGVSKKYPERIVLFCRIDQWDDQAEEWWQIDGFLFEITPQEFGLKKFF